MVFTAGLRNTKSNSWVPNNFVFAHITFLSLAALCPKTIKPMYKSH